MLRSSAFGRAATARLDGRDVDVMDAGDEPHACGELRLGRQHVGPAALVLGHQVLRDDLARRYGRRRGGPSRRKAGAALPERRARCCRSGRKQSRSAAAASSL